MDREELKAQWLAEEASAHIHGWDFSHLKGRYKEEEELPWDYRAVVEEYLTPEKRLLDLDTGGGEFLLSLGHPYENTAAAEAYPPNVELCREKLLPLGIDFRPAEGKGPLPWPEEYFDLVIDRHGDFSPPEVARVLRPGGIFITQQVGAQNDRELVELLLPESPLPFPENHLSAVTERFQKQGFGIIEGQEAFRPIHFYDVGALVWFARIIEWEFPGFSVESCFDRLLEAQRLLEERGDLKGTIHRFLLAARKPEGGLH